MEVERPTEPVLVDWQQIEDRLLSFTYEAVARFATAHPDETYSFFSYDVDLPYFLLSFDTPANAIEVAQRTEQEAIARRAKMLTLPDAWHGARHFSNRPPVLDYSYSGGYFAYHAFVDIKIDELEDIGFAENYPRDDHGDDYAEGNTRIILWRVIERLIASDVFRQLSLASPFRLGYQMHDDALTVLRILNWPQIE
jgi:hypothetical protein